MTAICWSCFLVTAVAILALFVSGVPVNVPPQEYDPSSSLPMEPDVEILEMNKTENGTKEMYVIKTVVYEVGVLVDVPENETDADQESNDGDDEEVHQQVDLTFYDAKANGTNFDFGDIPLPYQTKVNGQVMTAVAPVHVGGVDDISNISDVLSVLPVTGTIVNITKSDTGFLNITSHNVTDSEQELKGEDLRNEIPLLMNNQELIPKSLDDAVEKMAVENVTI